MKKILFVNDRLGGGGAERVMVLLANKLAQIGYNVSIALFCDPGVPNYELEKSVHLEYLINPNRLDKIFTDNILENIRCKIQEKSMYWNERYSLFVLDESKTKPLRSYLKKENFDTVISFLVEPNIATIRAAKGLPCKIIISERNVPVSYRVSIAMQRIRDRVYPRCHVCVFQTKEIQEWYDEKIGKKGVIILNPLKDNLPEPQSNGNCDKIVTNFCGFKAQKNLPLLIKAFSLFHKTHLEYKLHIFGDGDRTPLDRLIQDLKIEECVEIFPFSYDIHRKVINYKMFVSSSDFEGISNSMLEAMAIGLPTICTDCDGGGARETITDHVNGLLVPKGDVHALARAMSEVADNDQLADSLSQSAVLIRDSLRLDVIVQKWIDIIET